MLQMWHESIARTFREETGNARPRRFATWCIAVAAVLLASGLGSAQGPDRRAQRDPAARSPSKAPAKPAAVPADGQHPLAGVMEFAAESREALKDVKDYTAIFTKTELVGKHSVTQVMDMKLREKPFSVYFRYRSKHEEGREVIYVAGANNDTALVHEVGIKAIAGTVHIRPNGREVMEENRYPISQVGIANMLETAYQIWETEMKHSDPSAVRVEYYPNAKLGDVPCKVVEITHSEQRKELKFYVSRVYFDKETKLPIRAERFGWPRRPGEKPPLVEQYTYSNLRTNVGLTNVDFDPRNRQYGF
jgi:hypothetical protein